MNFSLQAGLVFRRGARTLELTRELPDGSLALEDCLTRMQVVYKRHKLLKLLWSGDLVREGADKALRNDKGELSVPPPSMSALSPKALKEVERRMAYVKAMHKAHLSRGNRPAIRALTKATASQIQDPKMPSASTVMDWLRRYEKAGCYAGALISGDALRRRQTRLPAQLELIIENALKRVYLQRDGLSLRHTQAVINDEAAKAVRQGVLDERFKRVSLSTLTRRLAAIDKYRVIESREGAARARMVCRTTMDGTTAEYPLQTVEVDHTPMNWVVLCDKTGLPLGRPMLTVLIDAYSNYVLGFYISFYGAGLTSVSGALRCAIQPKADMTSGLRLEHEWVAHGIPDRLVLDNGLEFHSPVFQRMGWELGTDFTYCRVRTPWLKPHVERFFGTLDTLTLAKGRIHKRVANVVQMDPVKGAAVMFSDFVKGIVQFVVDFHPFQINQRKLARPYDLYVEGIERRPPVLYPPNLEALRMASAMSTQLTVGPGGVELRGLPFGGTELLEMRKRHGERFKALVKWDPDDMGQIWVQDPSSREWVASACRWGEYASGLSFNQHITIRKFALQEFKKNDSFEYLERARLQLHEHWMESVAWKTKADRKLAAVASGYTSARTLNGTPQVQAPETSAPSAATSAAASASAPPSQVVQPLCAEDFETIDLA